MKLGIRSQRSIVKNYILTTGFWLLILLLTQYSANSKETFSCPNDVETLTNILLRDLPSYANRVTQRARVRNSSVEVYGYFIVAGRAELAPLTLGPGVYSPTTSEVKDNIQQIFFTTLQRRYTTTKAIQIQDYHWLFLTKSDRGWRLAMMYSMTGPYPGGSPPTAPRESSNGVVAQAIELWLRDCRAGSIRF